MRPAAILIPFLFLGLSSAQTLVITPNPLNLSVQANVQASATLTLTSSGTAIANISIVPAVAWLHVSQSSVSVTPATITVTADPMPASPQPYLGSISVVSSAGAVSVPVSLTVSTVGASPGNLTFQYVSGSTTPPPAQNVTVAAPAGATFHVGVGTNSGGAWLQGGVPLGSPTTVMVQVNPLVAQTLLAGTYTGTLTITPDSGASTGPAIVQVTLAVAATPVVTFTPASLTYNYQSPGGTNNSTTQNVQVASGTQDVGNFAFGGDAWITATPQNGTLKANQTAPISVTITPPSTFVASATPYSGSLVFNSASPQTIPVKVNVSSNPLLNVDLTPLTFTYPLGAAPPSSKTLATSSTSTPLSYLLSVATTAGGNWLSAVASGSATTPNPFTVSVDTGKLAPGTYTGTVTVTSSGLQQQIPVTLKVTNDAQLVTSASSLSFVYEYNRVVPQPPQTLTLTSNGIPLGYSATSSADWLIVIDQGHGTTDGGALTVSVNPAGVPSGVNLAQISIAVKSLITGGSLGTVVVPVTLYTATSGLLAVDPIQPVVFSIAAGSGLSQRQDVRLFSTSDLLTLAISPPKTDSGGNWLGILSQPSNTPGTLTLVAAPPTSLAPGTYTGSVTVNATGGPAPSILDSPYVIPVVLHVTTGTLSTSISGLKFTQAVGGASPPAQSVDIRSDPPALNFFATAYDGGLGWLSVSSTTGGIAPGSVTVSVDGSRLSTGVYDGRVILTSPFAGNSPLVVPVTLSVAPGAVSAAPSQLTFTQAFGGSAPPAQNLTLTGSPAGFAFTVTAAADNGAWLKPPTPSSGSLPATLQITVDGGNLPVGTYTGKLTVAAQGGPGSIATIGVTLNVVSSQPLTASPLTLNYNYTIGQPAPPAQQLQVSSLAANIAYVTAVSGSAPWLQVTPPSGNTPATLAVSINPQTLTTAGKFVGLITITSPNSVTAVTVTVNLTVTVSPPPVQTPVITSLVNAGSYKAGAVSPGENVILFGTLLGPVDLVNGHLNSAGAFDTVAGATRVLFDGAAAPVIYASAKQTSVMVPYGIAGRATTTVRVEYQDVAGDPVTYNVALTAPGIYTTNQQGTAQAAILNQDGVTANSATAPAPKGSVIAVYMTGEGQTTPGGSDGAITPGVLSALKTPQLPVAAKIGGLDAKVLYYGSAPNLVNGVMQVNIEIPALAASGPSVPIVITVGTTATQSNVTVAIQ